MAPESPRTGDPKVVKPNARTKRRKWLAGLRMVKTRCERYPIPPNRGCSHRNPPLKSDQHKFRIAASVRRYHQEKRTRDHARILARIRGGRRHLDPETREKISDAVTATLAVRRSRLAQD